MLTRRVLSATGDVALELLRLTAKSAEVFPPLQRAAELALRIADLVRNFNSNKDEWRELGTYVRDATASVAQSLACTSPSHTEMMKDLEKLKAVLDEVENRIRSEQALPWHKRMGRFMRDVDMITDMKSRIDNTISLFQLNATVLNMKDLGKTFEAVIANREALSKISDTTTDVLRKASMLGVKTALDRLPRIQGAAWNPLRACMDNTRVELINNILAWVNDLTKSGGAEIMLLTGVAGSGKTSVAHTVARECRERRQLGSSFFFDRETAGRNSPDAVFTTIAADLSRLDNDLATNIAHAVESNSSLSVPQQFSELVLKPSRRCHVPGPIVLVIDALDEAWDSDFVRLLQDHISMLPNVFRIFLTSRMRPDLTPLLHKPHVIGVELDINAQSNMEDMEIYVRSKLRELVNARDDLESDWPGEKLRVEFIAKAEGLFLWVATVCDYLHNRDDLTQELEHLVSGTGLLGSPAQDKMNRLYARILEGFDWSDARFVSSYHRVMGTALATKTPLTIAAMKQLYHEDHLASDFTLHRLSPLLTGMRKADHETQPVRVLHQSLRDFLAVETPCSSLPVDLFKIVEKEHSRELAVLCLELLNRDLNDTTPGTGYIAKDEEEEPGIPALREDAIPEALRYACIFLQDHLYDLESPKSINEAMREFMMKRAEIGGSDSGQILWQSEMYAEILWSLSDRLYYEDRREEALLSIEEAVQLYRELATERPALFISRLALYLHSLSNHLEGLGRYEEALVAIEETVQLYRQPATNQLAAPTGPLALSLNRLSICLAKLGRHEEALVTVEEAGRLYQQLETDQPTAFTSDRARCLNNLSLCLSALGRNEEALGAIKEAEQLYRQLAKDQPAQFASDFAMSLNNLSVRLSDLSRHEEALVVIKEAEQLYRQLAKDRPAAFASNLATSLDNFSTRLSELGRHEEALVAIEEAEQIYRKLAKERPAAFTPELARCLHNLSLCLSKIGRREEALAAVEEAVKLYRRLAKDRPAALTPYLAGSLDNLSVRLSELGRHEEALVASEEAKQLYKQLAKERPAIFAPDLAKSLNTLSIRLSELGHREQALVAIEEAEQLYRQLAKDQPAAFISDLAKSLNDLSLRLSDSDRPEEALVAIKEAVQLYQQLAKDRPAAFTPKLALSFYALSIRMSELDRRQEAMVAIEEAVQLYRQLMRDRPAAFTTEFALSLINLSLNLSDLGRPEEALAAIEEAVTIQRQLTAQHSLTVCHLKSSLHILARQLISMGRHHEALDPINEAGGLSS
ncbi:POC1 centriolar protein A [Ceratobasidium sp. 395]|nr:POC1 centriolar protein A [Ceratobasidium sp. 395]